MNTYYVELNFSGNVNLETGIAVSQGDYGNNQFSIATKKDGSFIADAISAEIIFNLTNGYIVTGDLEGSGGLYTYTFKGNELQSPGKTTCMVTLHFKDGRTSSEAFVFDVRYNPLYDRKIDAGPYLTELEKIKNQAQGYVDYLEILIEQLKKDVGETALTKADLQNDLLQSTPGLKALDAALGSILLTKTDAAEKFASKEDVKGFLTSDIIDNNLLGTDPTHVLASPQGKALADQIAQLNSNLNGLRVFKSQKIEDSNTYACDLPLCFAIVYGGNRAGYANPNDNFLLLVDTTQSKFNYFSVAQGNISEVTWNEGILSITFNTPSFWQINALCIYSIG